MQELGVIVERYKHMGFSAGAERHKDASYAGSYPIAMLFWLAGDEVVRMSERIWPHLSFATDADAADYAERQCRLAIDAEAAASPILRLPDKR